FRFLCIGGHVNAAVFDEARRRIDQILAGLDALVKVPVEMWPDIELPFLEACVQDSSEDPKNPELAVTDAHSTRAEESSSTAPREDNGRSSHHTAQGIESGDVEPPER